MCIPSVIVECNAYLPDKDIPRAGTRWEKFGRRMVGAQEPVLYPMR